MAQTVLILGANGRIARQAEKIFLSTTEDKLVYFLRDSQRLSDEASERVTVVEGDASKEDEIVKAIRDNHVTAVYVNLAGDMEAFTRNVIAAMDETGVSRLVFIASLGIYDEVPGEFGRWNNKELTGYLPKYTRSAELIESSDLDYAILRPAWLDDDDEIDYETTGRHDAFKGTTVSRRSVGDLVVKAIDDTTGKYDRVSLGVDKPGTDGDRPTFMR